MNTGIIIDILNSKVLAEIDELHGKVLAKVNKLPLATFVGCIIDTLHVEESVVLHHLNLKGGVVANHLNPAPKLPVVADTVAGHGGARKEARRHEQYDINNFHLRFGSLVMNKSVNIIKI